MDYLIIFHGEPIGKLVEPKADVWQGIVGGRFLPLPAYKEVQPVFQAYAQLVSEELKSGKRDNKRMKDLGQKRDMIAAEISITTLEGAPVEILGIDIDDFSGYLGDEGYEAHFVVTTHEFFHNPLLWNQQEVVED
jgi:hypothetical protein